MEDDDSCYLSLPLTRSSIVMLNTHLCMSFPLAEASIVLQGDPMAKAARAADTAASTSAVEPSETCDQ